MLDSSSRFRKPVSHVENSGFKSPIEYQLYAVSLMERTGGYGPSDMGSIPVLRAKKFEELIL